MGRGNAKASTESGSHCDESFLAKSNHCWDFLRRFRNSLQVKEENKNYLMLCCDGKLIFFLFLFVQQPKKKNRNEKGSQIHYFWVF